MLKKFPIQITTIPPKERDLIFNRVRIADGNSTTEIEVFDDMVYDSIQSTFGLTNGNGVGSYISKENLFKKILRKKKRDFWKRLKKVKMQENNQMCHNLARAYHLWLKLIQGVSTNMEIEQN